MNVFNPPTGFFFDFDFISWATEKISGQQPPSSIDTAPALLPAFSINANSLTVHTDLGERLAFAAHPDQSDAFLYPYIDGYWLHTPEGEPAGMLTFKKGSVIFEKYGDYIKVTSLPTVQPETFYLNPLAVSESSYLRLLRQPPATTAMNEAALPELSNNPITTHCF